MTKPDPASTAAHAVPKPQRHVGRGIGLTLFGIVSGIVVIALIAAGFGLWVVQRSFPQTDGTIQAKGLHSNVTVMRNDRGIPNITAGDTHDLFFAQGYVHAQDRFWEMDFRRHVTSGRLSELFGTSQLPTDEFLRTLGWHRIAQQEVDKMDAATRAYYQAYADGVNAYLSTHQGSAVSLEYAVLGLQNPDYTIQKWTPADSVAWLKAMAWDLRDNVEAETERATLAPNYSTAQLHELYPDYPYDKNPVIVPTISTTAPAPAAAQPATAPASTIQWKSVDTVVEAAGALLGGVGEGIGSNSWVVSGALTASGKPMLSNDPHLGAAMPSVWYQVGLRCAKVTADCPFDVAGFSFSGLPGVVIGHNAKIAWGFTNLTTDVTDLYIEKVQGDTYWRDGQLVPLEKRTETFKVAGGPDVKLTVRSTVHGPIISSSGDFATVAKTPAVGSSTGEVGPPQGAPEGETAVSLQWTALQPGTTAEAIFALNTAQDFAGFRHAASLFDVPAQNLIYADTKGNIGYQTPGRLPIRGAGDGWMPQPGWDSAYDWKGYIPFDQLPVSYNPTSGFIVTANNAIVPPNYPYFLTKDWDYGWRAAQITDMIERLSSDHKLTADDMRTIQADTSFWMGKRLIQAYADVKVDDKGTASALALLQNWDARNEADSPAATYANVLWDELAKDLFTEREHPVSLDGQGRLFLVVDKLLSTPDSPWWKNDRIGVTDQRAMLEKAATDAYHRLVKLQGDNTSKWNWGTLHALTLTNATFGKSGIAPIEWLFNRGPFPVSGGASVVDATGWVLGEGFQTVTVPSMRMIVDLSGWDKSQWNHLTGESGHAFHANYFDQTEDWQNVQLRSWAFSPQAVAADSTHSLILTP
ncbi:penicillin acylase family protein [Microbacterium sp. ASV49]|uniref:Penicillin acylase family protein n=1 Tax=Microbacterium candidum TaxID=3041922 RepID=A0ABT7MUF6_9MICO|nr:penicillin acylase family protein [Microbacterium sp. ASV49]MDL9978087.1 penicillin acylase family protein [Microbacterium sp. ASV49]